MEINGTNNYPGSPSQNLLDEIDYDLEQPVWGLEQLKQAAIEQRLPRPRSLAWAILLEVVPPPNGDIVSTIKTSRNFYNEMKKKLSMDPRGAIGDDPLSQNDESVWRQHFCDIELKSLILQDVVRTFPDELYFRDKDVQDLMVRVLFFWSRSHAQLGYRQGMHEILAPLLLELFVDREFAPRELSDKLKYILSEEHLEHDSHMLFAAVIRGLEKFYITGDMIVPSSCGRRLSRHPNEVLRYLDRVKEDFLVPLDPELATHLTNSNISMELFGIRWLRLLFGREFPRAELAALWGFAFAAGPALPDLNLLVAALLLAARRQHIVYVVVGCVRATVAGGVEASQQRGFIAVLDLLRKAALATGSDLGNDESQERDKEAFLSVLDKLKAVVNDGGDWDSLDIQEDELATFQTRRFSKRDSQLTSAEKSCCAPLGVSAMYLHHTGEWT